MGKNQPEELQHLQTTFLKRSRTAKLNGKRREKYQDERIGFLPNVHPSLCVVVNVVAGDQASALQSKKDARRPAAVNIIPEHDDLNTTEGE